MIRLVIYLVVLAALIVVFPPLAGVWLVIGLVLLVLRIFHVGGDHRSRAERKLADREAKGALKEDQAAQRASRAQEFEAKAQEFGARTHEFGAKAHGWSANVTEFNANVLQRTVGEAIERLETGQ